MLIGKERKKEQICKVKQRQMKKIYIKINFINFKGKRTVGKASKGINVEKIILGLKIKNKKREKKEKNKGKCHKTAKAQQRGRGL